MCIQPFYFLKNIFSIKNLGTNKDKTSANFIVVSDKHFKPFGGIDGNPPNPLSHNQQCIPGL